MNQNSEYRIPVNTHIGHVHLKVSELQRSIDFYCGMLGFEISQLYGEEAAFLSAGGYHHHIGLNVWFSKDGPRPSQNSTGLFHTAILYPSRKDLAAALKQLLDNEYPITGASDHGVSEAIYLDDPDKNGVELYWDKPVDQWPRNKDGTLSMYTRALDLKDLLEEIQN